MNLKLILILILHINIMNAFSCDYVDLTKDPEDTSVPDTRVDPSNQKGAILAWKDMKKMNKKYLIGTVDDVVMPFEGKKGKACQHFNDPKFKDARVVITKKSFKTYFVTCEPLEACGKFNLQDELKNIKSPKFDGVNGLADGETFQLITGSGDNYEKAYVNTRVNETYTNFDDNPHGLGQFDPEKMSIHEFLENELKESLKEVAGTSDISTIDLNDPKFKKPLEENINLIRADKMDQVDKKYIRMATILDALEKPYSVTSNFEDELQKALLPEIVKEGEKPKQIKAGKYTVALAQSGDDITAIVKEGNKVVKIVGGDAIGLGVLNMTKRLEAYQVYVKENNRDKVKSLQDWLDISHAGINGADTTMFTSMDVYVDSLIETLSNPGEMDIDEIVFAANEKYKSKKNADSNLMDMRSGASDPCAGGTKCIKNQITIVHNNVKSLEGIGIAGFLGDSCIGSEFWVRKFGAKPMFTPKDVVE